MHIRRRGVKESEIRKFQKAEAGGEAGEGRGGEIRAAEVAEVSFASVANHFIAPGGFLD